MLNSNTDTNIKTDLKIKELSVNISNTPIELSHRAKFNGFKHRTKVESLKFFIV